MEDTYKMTYVECGKHKFNTSDPGVTSIGRTEGGVFVINHKDGNRHFLFPGDTFLVKEEKVDIIVPEIILAS